MQRQAAAGSGRQQHIKHKDSQYNDTQHYFTEQHKITIWLNFYYIKDHLGFQFQ
jgi:hypothetical protein